ncbi:DUF4422 domain-containing protein [Adlercreutzia sp. ZJ154]|uniref:DUF4422 domain-containing protein n=1 Tax=Adlercreutzia sp. ZJ154 TaxID=2709790 RepID=UPI00197DB52B|nr:DUF4422 domain-containing protein [Adlercreutzia sp. ZJ154]
MSSANPDIKIVVASHKPYWMPSDPMYIPVQVGAAGKETIPGFQRDDEGENISDKNPRYSELTALYWAWKNLDADYIGLAHYRRHFAGKGERGVLTYEEAKELIAKSPVVLPKKRHYVIETVKSHYDHTMDDTHMDILRNILEDKSPEILPAFDAHMRSRSAHIWNMVIMRRDILDRWCSWLFPVLEEIESCLNFARMTPFEMRCIGRISERLLDPWLSIEKTPVKEIPVFSMEKINWSNKGKSFLSAKFANRKYVESF